MNNDYTRDEVIDLTLKWTDYIRSLSMEELCKQPDKATRIDYPQTEPETYVVKLLHIYLTEGWLQPNTEPLLDEIKGQLAILDSGVSDHPKTWTYLFELVDELRHTERPQPK